MQGVVVSSAPQVEKCLERVKADGRTVVLRGRFALIERMLRFGSSEVGVPVIRGPLDCGAEVWHRRGQPNDGRTIDPARVAARRGDDPQSTPVKTGDGADEVDPDRRTGLRSVRRAV